MTTNFPTQTQHLSAAGSAHISQDTSTNKPLIQQRPDELCRRTTDSLLVKPAEFRLAGDY